MALRSIKFQSFRNYSNFKMDVTEGITVITGKNGVGKSSILEAVCLLGTGRSFRSAKSIDFIKKGNEVALISAHIDNFGLNSAVDIKIYPQGKKVFVDEKLAKSTAKLSNILPSIIFSPYDHQIIEGDSADRKFFLNRSISLIDFEYSEILSSFNKTLLQRNKILRDALELQWPQTKIADHLCVWDESFIRLGSKLLDSRYKYILELKPIVEQEYRKISGINDEFKVKYLPMDSEELTDFHPQTINNWEEIIEQKLKSTLRRDTALGTTSSGPHKDEILLILNGNKVKFYGSQGEKRTCALALRLGELALYRQRMQRQPILLFDDVSSELDRNRRQSLVSLLRHEKAQVMITATELPSALMEEANKSFEHLELEGRNDV